MSRFPFPGFFPAPVLVKIIAKEQSVCSSRVYPDIHPGKPARNPVCEFIKAKDNPEGCCETYAHKHNESYFFKQRLILKEDHCKQESRDNKHKKKAKKLQNHSFSSTSLNENWINLLYSSLLNISVIAT